MAPNSFFAGDCQAISMGQLFDALLATSINYVCVDSVEPAGPRVCSPTYDQDEMKKGQASASAQHAPNVPRPAVSSSSGSKERQLHQNTDHEESESSSNPSVAHYNLLRPPLHQPAPRPSFRDRKKNGLSIQPPSFPSDRNESPDIPPIYCAKNVEMRRKSLLERHFFRPVSEDDESTIPPY